MGVRLRGSSAWKARWKVSLNFVKFDSCLLLLHPRLTSQEDVKRVYGREENYQCWRRFKPVILGACSTRKYSFWKKYCVLGKGEVPFHLISNIPNPPTPPPPPCGWCSFFSSLSEIILYPNPLQIPMDEFNKLKLPKKYLSWRSIVKLIFMF